MQSYVDAFTMDYASLVTLAALGLFFHIMIFLLFSKFILSQEPSTGRQLLCFCLLATLPLLGAVLVYRMLNLNWFRNEDGSKRSGAISIDFLELDAIFNPGSKQIIEERQREKMAIRQDGEKLDPP